MPAPKRRQLPIHSRHLNGGNPNANRSRRRNPASHRQRQRALTASQVTSTSESLTVLADTHYRQCTSASVDKKNDGNGGLAPLSHNSANPLPPVKQPHSRKGHTHQHKPRKNANHRSHTARLGQLIQLDIGEGNRRATHHDRP